MINLSKRLSVIANMITDSNIVNDIGCDHALLDIYLLQSKKVKKVVASDITPGALNQAKGNVKKYDVKEIDLSNISLETDSPYLSPEPLRGKVNVPKNIIYIARKIAELKSVSLKEVLEITSSNVTSKFDL